MTKIKQYFIISLSLLFFAGSVFAAPFQIPVGSIGMTPSTNQIAFTWTQPAPNGAPVTGYRMEYRQTQVGAGINTNTYNLFSMVNTPSVTVTGLTSGTTYDFRLTPIDNTGDGIVSEVTVSTVLDSPINLAGSQINGGVSLNWNAPQTTSIISDYRIEYREFGTTTSFLVYNDGVSASTNANLSGLTNGKMYEFKVSAYNGAIGRPSNSINITAGNTPSVPNNLSANAGIIANTVNLVWTAPVSYGASPVSDYVIDYRQVGGVWSTYSDGVSSQTNAGLLGLSPNTQYEFRVSAANSQGTGSPSLSVNYTTPSSQVAAYPTQVQGTASGTNCIALQWIAPSNTGFGNITDYIIEYRTGSNTFTQYADGVNTNTSASICNLVGNTYYDFRIISVNQAGNSTPSQVSSIWTMQNTTSIANSGTPSSGSPSIPAAVNFSSANNGVNASWLPGSAGDCSVIDYIVEYKKTFDTIWTEFKDGTSALNSLVVTGLNNGTGYDFRLLAVNCKGKGEVTKTYQATPSANAKACLPIITRYLKKGASNDRDNMIRLQDFLRDDEKLLSAASNGVFGPATYAAVVKFQQKYSYDTLLPWKLTKGSGWVYMTTTKKINDLYCSYHP